ncbi:hypothetical protein [Rickettsia asembonensis]|uniref:hypothetical protein n=1 Tax=Rickettsia asembonensis TaxID=1068590 RepID=UPI0011BAC0D7|nr:hypothetical protein [Rickettsia asembonensis]
MSFLAKQESNKPIKNLFFIGLFYHVYTLDSCFRGKALLRGSVKPTVSPRGLTSVVAWINFTSVIPWSNHGMTEVKLIHATMPRGNDIKRIF